jgi:1-acyl-sn-glycerol-3-phosphate acyltransferase
MIWLRSALFAALACAWTAVLMLLFLPLLALPRKQFQYAAAIWCRGVIGLARTCCGISWRVTGSENLPRGPAIIAAKHQSAWDTLIFHLLLDDPVFVLKRELLVVPFLGWYLRKAGGIGIDRSAGFRAIRSMLPRVDRALDEGSQIIVFPEGTRTAPGQRRPYQPGVAALYARAEVPLIPIALNSGMVWGRRKFLKFPGVITFEVLPAMPKGWERGRFLRELEQRIEEATERLCGGVETPEPGAAFNPVVEPGCNGGSET